MHTTKELNLYYLVLFTYYLLPVSTAYLTVVKGENDS